MKFQYKLHRNIITDITLLLAAALSIFFSDLDIFNIILSITVHELGHIIAALAVGAKLENFSIHGFGVEITFPGKTPTKRKMLLISSGGPVASVILALIGYQLNNFTLFIVNFSITIINLIPAYPLDGGQIIYSLLSSSVTRKNLNKILKFSGKIFGIVLIIFGTIILFISEINFSLIYMGFFIFFSSGRLSNPVVETFTTDYPKIEKISLFTADSSMSNIEIADNLPASSIAALKNKNGEIISFVTPLYLYNKSIEKSRP